LLFPRQYVSEIQSAAWCSWVSGRFLDGGIWKICEVVIAVFLEEVATRRGKMQRHFNRSATHAVLKSYSLRGEVFHFHLLKLSKLKGYCQSLKKK